MSAPSTNATTCLPATTCTRRDPGHFESPDQQRALTDGHIDWQYGTVRRTDNRHVTTVDLEDGTSLPIWSHRHRPVMLSAGTQVAVHKTAQLMIVKKVLATQISVLVMDTPELAELPLPRCQEEHGSTSAGSRVAPADLADLAPIFERLTNPHR